MQQISVRSQNNGGKHQVCADLVYIKSLERAVVKQRAVVMWCEYKTCHLEDRQYVVIFSDL